MLIFGPNILSPVSVSGELTQDLSILDGYRWQLYDNLPNTKMTIDSNTTGYYSFVFNGTQSPLLYIFDGFKGLASDGDDATSSVTITPARYDGASWQVISSTSYKLQEVTNNNGKFAVWDVSGEYGMGTRPWDNIGFRVVCSSGDRVCLHNAYLFDSPEYGGIDLSYLAKQDADSFYSSGTYRYAFPFPSRFEMSKSASILQQSTESGKYRLVDAGRRAKRFLLSYRQVSDEFIHWLKHMLDMDYVTLVWGLHYFEYYSQQNPVVGNFISSEYSYKEPDSEATTGIIQNADPYRVNSIFSAKLVGRFNPVLSTNIFGQSLNDIDIELEEVGL